MWIPLLEEAHAAALKLAARRAVYGRDRSTFGQGTSELDLTITWRGRRATILALLGGAAIKLRLPAGFTDEDLLEALRRAYVTVVIRAPSSPSARVARRARIEQEKVDLLEYHLHHVLRARYLRRERERAKALPERVERAGSWWERFLRFVSRQ